MLVCSHCGKARRACDIVDGVPKPKYDFRTTTNEDYEVYLTHMNCAFVYLEYKALCSFCYGDLDLLYVDRKKREEIIASPPALKGY
jgi:hypothetical protein